MTKSILPPNTLPNGSHIVFTDKEEAVVKEGLRQLGKNRMERALTLYRRERDALPANEGPWKAKPILHHICPDLEHRGISPVAVQLINVTAAQSWEFFQTFVKRLFKEVTV